MVSCDLRLYRSFDEGKRLSYTYHCKQTAMERLVGVVGGYRERDKFIRLCSYTARFLAGSGQTKWGIRLTTIATELSACRTVLRLFDDVPMLAHTLRYGSGSKVSK